jgi:hypothetical protein
MSKSNNIFQYSWTPINTVFKNNGSHENILIFVRLCSSSSYALSTESHYAMTGAMLEEASGRKSMENSSRRPMRRRESKVKLQLTRCQKLFRYIGKHAMHTETTVGSPPGLNPAWIACYTWPDLALLNARFSCRFSHERWSLNDIRDANKNPKFNGKNEELILLGIK